jgi:hypothetical protein
MLKVWDVLRAMSNPRHGLRGENIGLWAKSWIAISASQSFLSSKLAKCSRHLPCTVKDAEKDAACDKVLYMSTLCGMGMGMSSATKLFSGSYPRPACKASLYARCWAGCSTKSAHAHESQISHDGSGNFDLPSANEPRHIFLTCTLVYTWVDWLDGAFRSGEWQRICNVSKIGNADISI